MEQEIAVKKAITLKHTVDLPTKTPTSIAYNRDGIWVADNENAMLYLVDYATGDVIKRQKTIVRRPQTISWDGDYLWEYDEESSNLYKRSLEGDECRYFGQVEGVVTPYLGLAYRDDTLWLISPDQPFFTVANNEITVIKFPRRIKFETYEAPLYSCRGLSHDGRYLWTLDLEGKEIFALDPLHGGIVTSYELPEVKLPTSLVVADDMVWTLDLKDNKLLTYSLDRSVPHTVSGGRRSHVEVVNRIHNNGPGMIRKMEFSQQLPFDYINQRMLSMPKVIPNPDRSFPCEWEGEGGEMAVNYIKDIAPNEDRETCLSFDIDTFDVKFHIYPHRVGSLDKIPAEIRDRYLFSEIENKGNERLREVLKRAQYLFQTGEQALRDKAAEIVGQERNPFWMARKIYDFVVDKIGYILPYMSLSSLKILEQSRGSCGNHTTIYIALCQAVGLATRSITGFSLWKDDSRLGYLDHELPEVYLPNYGWIPADTSRFMSLPVYGTHPITKYRSFGTFADRFFINGFGRDLMSPLSQEHYLEEPLMECDGECSRSVYFFLRWQSREVPR